MKKLQLHIEVIHNGGEMILALEDNIPGADAFRRLKKAQSDPRAFPRLAVDEVDGDVTVTPWKDLEDDDLDSMETEFVAFPAKYACEALHVHFGWDRALLREALAPSRIERLSEEGRRGCAEALRNLGLLDKGDLH